MAYTTDGDGDWDNAGSWDEEGVPPSPADAAISILHDISMNDDVDLGGQTLTIAASKTLTIEAGETLTLAGGAVAISGTLAVEGTIASSLGSITVASGGELFLDAGSTYSFVDNLTVDSGGVFDVDIDLILGGTSTVNGDMACSGSLEYAESSSPGGAGTITFDASSGDPTLTCNGYLIPPTEVDNSPDSFTLADAARFTSSIFTAGSFDDNGETVSVVGDLKVLDGGLTSTGIWTTSSSGDVQVASTSPLFKWVVAAGAEATLTNDVWLKSLGGSGTIVGDGNDLVFFNEEEDFWDFTGTAETNVELYNLSSSTMGRDMVVDGDIWFRSSSTLQYTPDKSVDCSGEVLISGDNGGDVGDSFELTLDGTGFRAGSLVLGRVQNKNHFGILNCGSGPIFIEGSIARGHADNGANELNLESCYLELGGEFDGDGITVTADAGAVHVQGVGESASITNVESDSPIFAHDCEDGGDNVNVSFDEHCPPSSLTLLGAGC